MIVKEYDEKHMTSLRDGHGQVRQDCQEIIVTNDCLAWTTLIRFLPHIMQAESMKKSLCLSTFTRDDRIALKAVVPGRYECEWNEHLLVVRLERDGENSETAYITKAPGRKSDDDVPLVEIVESFLAHARQLDQALKNEEGELVQSKVLRGGTWKLIGRSNKRAVSTFVTVDDAAERLIEDSRAFLAAETEYARFGMAFKRNILIIGCPGSGKSSLVHILASALDFDVAYMHVTPDLNEREICNGVSQLTEKTLLVLEDVDVICSAAAAGSAAAAASIAVLTSVLDGVLHRHGLITIMTSAVPDALDTVLVRRGRVDYTCNLQLPNRAQIQKIVATLRPECKGDEELIEAISDRVESRRLSSASVAHFLFLHRNDSYETILNATDELVRDTREQAVSSGVGEGLYF